MASPQLHKTAMNYDEKAMKYMNERLKKVKKEDKKESKVLKEKEEEMVNPKKRKGLFGTPLLMISISKGK